MKLAFNWGRIAQLFADDGAVGSRVARSSAVLFVGRFLLKAVYFIRTIVLARLLLPEDFGLFGLAAVSLGFTSVFFTSGLNSSLVHTKDDPKKYLDAMWTVGILRNTILAFAICATAPFAAQFFENPSIIPMIYVLAFATFLTGFENIGIVLLDKELRFGRKFLFDFTTVVLEVLSVVIAAFWLRSAWALVFGALANRFFAAAISYWFHPYRPRLTRDLSGAWKLFGYGKWVALAGILGFLIGQGDNIVIGKLLSTEELGYYQLAFTLAFLPALEFSRVLGSVLFPMFSRFQDDAGSLERSFVKASRMIFAVVTPMSFGMLAVIPEFVRIFYGAKWMPMVPIVSILMIYGFLRSFEFIAKPLLMGIGRPQMTLVTQIAQFAAMFIAIVPLTQMFGVRGTAIAVVLGGFVSLGILLVAVNRHFHFGFAQYADMLAASLVASLAMYAVLVVLKPLLDVTSVVDFLALILLGVALYAGPLFVFDRLRGGKIVASALWLKERLS